MSRPQSPGCWKLREARVRWWWRGMIVANGPLGEQSDPSLRGLSIFACGLEEARRLSDLDPSVQAGRLGYEVFEWWVVAGTLAFPGTANAVGERRVMPDD